MSLTNAKRYFSFMMALSLVLSLISVPVYATENEETIPAIETTQYIDTSLETEAPEVATNPASNDRIVAIEQKMDAILLDYLKTTVLPEEDVINIVTNMPWDTMQTALDRLNALDAETAELSENEIAQLRDGYEGAETMACFYETLVLSTTPTSYAATSGDHTPVDGVRVNVSGATDNSMSNNIITVTAKGTDGFLWMPGSSKTTTITVYNELTVDGNQCAATISFDWETTNMNQLTIDGVVRGATDSFSKRLDYGASFTITIVTGTNSTTNTLKMKNFGIEKVADKSKVTFYYDNTLGSITVDGEEIANEDELEIAASGAAVTATPANSNIKFLGWINDTTGAKFDAGATLKFSEDTHVRAVFASATTDAWFEAGGTHWFDDLNEASDFALTVSNRNVVLLSDGTLPEGSYTIDGGVTLLIPFDEAHTLCTTEPRADYRDSTSTPPLNVSAYRTLTMATGASISVDGAISLSAAVNASNGGRPNAGSPYGPVSFIAMKDGSSITINKGGKLYAWGYITGSGNITAMSGSQVYECFQFMDFRGGTQLSSMASGKSANGVFPLSQYYVQNIEVPLEIQHGAEELCYSAVYASIFGWGSVQSTSIKLFSTSSAMFNISSGSVIKQYDGKSDRLLIDVKGTLDLSSLSVTVGNTPLNSKEYDLAINNNISVTAKSGSTINVNQDVALLPGVRVTIEEEASLKLASGINLYIYDSDQWGNYSFPGLAKFVPISYAPSKTYTRTAAKDLVDAQILVNGTVDASAGYIYTTAGKAVAKSTTVTDWSGGGANIYSTGTGIVKTNPGTELVTYQFQQTADSTNGISEKTYFQIPITPAQLKNEDGTYVATGEKGAGTYKYINGKWYKSIEIDKTNIAIGSGLDMYFYVKASDVGDDLANYKAVVTKHFSDWDKENSIQTYESTEWMPYPDATNIQYYRFGFSDISAKEMTDEIDAVIYHVDGTQVSKLYTQTIQNYVIQALEEYKEDTTPKTKLLKAALMDMLEYGTSAQEQFGYNVDNPANKAPEGVTTLTDHATYISTNDQEPKWENVKDYGNYTNIAGVTASATNTLMFTFYFNVTNISGMYAEVEYLAHGETEKTFKTINEFYERIENELYGVDVTTLSIIDGHQPITCTLYKADGSVAAVATDSIGGYAMRNKDNGAIFRDMMQFVDSAQAYFDYQS